MALITCPECGKEISDKATSCPNCGCPNSEFIRPEELPPEEWPEMFDCVKCGKKIPVNSEKCIFCNYIYKKVDSSDILNEDDTGVFGKKNLFCPKCGSKKIYIENDIPLWKKARDILLIGGIMPTTKADHRKGMIYICKSCGSRW